MSSYGFSASANFDVEKISFDLLALNPLAAERFLSALNQTCEMLTTHPLLGRARPELGKEVRSFPVGNYIVFYTPSPDGVDVARVIYGGRDLPKQFAA